MTPTRASALGAATSGLALACRNTTPDATLRRHRALSRFEVVQFHRSFGAVSWYKGLRLLLSRLLADFFNLDEVAHLVDHATRLRTVGQFHRLL